MPDKSTTGRSIIALRWLARAAPRIAAELALRRFATPTPLRLPAPTWTAEHATYWASGVRVAGFARGEGPVVALLHGWGGGARQFDAFVAPLVHAGFRVVAIDAPAHGASAGSRATVISFARSLEAVARVEGPLAGVIAHSLGASAATLAIAAGLEVERAVFLAPALDPRRHFEAFTAALGLDRGLMLRLAERRYGVSWQELAIVERARELSLPLLVFHDALDSAVSLEEVEPLVQNWHGAELRVTRGLGHRRLLTEPGVVAQAVAFVARERPRWRSLRAAE